MPPHVGAELARGRISSCSTSAVVSDLTPPTAVSCYVAGGIAGESGMRVAFSATRVALVAGVLMVVPGLANAAVGFAMMAVVAVMHRRRRLHEAI
jgi:TRAP-type uncharacterized transport system fused permease subunit